MCKFVCQGSVPLTLPPRSWPSASSTGSHHRRGPRREVPLAPLLVHQAVFPTAPLPLQMQLIRRSVIQRETSENPLLHHRWRARQCLRGQSKPVDGDGDCDDGNTCLSMHPSCGNACCTNGSEHCGHLQFLVLGAFVQCWDLAHSRCQ